MAQINVKVLEATAGKITEVEFDGAKFLVLDTDETVNEGDVMLAVTSSLDVTAGAFYEVIDVDYDNEAFFYDDDNDKTGRYPSEESALFFRKEEVKPQFETFEVGEYAKIINDNEHTRPVVSSHQFKEGEIVKVRRTNGTHADVYYVEDIREDDTWHVHAGDLEKLDADEVAEIVRQNTVLEEGDLVRVLNNNAGHKVGTIGVITRGCKASMAHVKAVCVDGVERTYYEEVELVAKADDRKDN